MTRTRITLTSGGTGVIVEGDFDTVADRVINTPRRMIAMTKVVGYNIKTGEWETTRVLINVEAIACVTEATP